MQPNEIKVKDLRNDPVLFAEIILGIQLHEGQKKILACKDRFIAVRAARRFGKSFVFSAYAAWYAATHPNSKIVCISKSQRQSSLMFETISGLINASQLSSSITRSTQTQLEFSNGSKILSLPGSNPDSIRGFTINLILIDEAAFVPEELFHVIYPSITSVKGTVVLISTPGLSSGEFYRACQPESEYTHMHLTHKDAVFADGTPLVDPAELEREIQRNGGEDSPAYRQEYLAEFTDSDGAFFRLDAIQSAVAYDYEALTIGNPERKYAIGLDVGMVRDFTVSSVIDYTDPENMRIVEYQRYTNCTEDEIAFKVGDQASRFNVTKILVDDGQAGKGVIREIRSLYPKYRVEAFNFNRKTKPALMTKMSTVLNKKQLSIPPDDDVLRELASLVYKENPETHYMRIAAAGNGHDDICMSFALAIEAAGVSYGSGSIGIATKRKRIGFDDRRGAYHPRKNRVALV